MTPIGQLSLAAAFASSILLSSCAQGDVDYFFNGPRDGSYQPAVQRSDDSAWYAQQNAAREANMRAVREQSYKNEMQNYQNGYRSTLPNY
ncbi:hypothetical protein [Luteolibacter sp. LG18]|uniref:hypothetical protein n=1 Tax=Luteolibacter sp. LG18 TaxID=2819286 RepID=UPI0030C7456C